jgi:hypothetical protein
MLRSLTGLLSNFFHVALMFLTACTAVGNVVAGDFGVLTWVSAGVAIVLAWQLTWD